MTNGERQFRPTDTQLAVISLADMLFGRDFADNRQGFQEAMEALIEQHEKVIPPVPSKDVLISFVHGKDPIIRMTEQMAALSLSDDDYEAALLTANHLFEYGEVDYQDSLSGDAFNLL